MNKYIILPSLSLLVIKDISPSLWTKCFKDVIWLLYIGSIYVLYHTILHFRFDYKTYLKYKDKINSLIKDGFNIAVVLDEEYDENIKILDIFSYVFVYEKYEYYDIVIENKDMINAKVISQWGVLWAHFLHFYLNF